MAQIQTFSLAYDAAEDRLALDARDAEGATTRMWLTQRFCRGFVAALLPMLEAASPHPPEHRGAVQSFEQQAAMAGFGKVPAVQPTPGAAVGLVRAAHITPAGARFDLSFEFDDQTRRVGLGQTEIRQTLQVMSELFAAAGWAMDIWPPWILQKTNAAPDAVN